MSLETISFIVGIIGLVVGIPGFVLAWPYIKNYARSRLGAGHVLVLYGPSAAGKTTLVRYLREEPLPLEHVSTHSYERSGKIVYDLSGNKTFFFTMKEVVDMGGGFRHQLKPVFSRYNPHAIILVCDTTREEEERKSLEDIANAYQEILSELPAEDLKLQVLLILLNQCDVWGNDTATQHSKKEHYVNGVLAGQIQRLRGLVHNLKVRTQAVALTHPAYKVHNDAVLRDLAQLLTQEDR